MWWVQSPSTELTSQCILFNLYAYVKNLYIKANVMTLAHYHIRHLSETDKDHFTLSIQSHISF